jgi:hypothetical protein
MLSRTVFRIASQNHYSKTCLRGLAFGFPGIPPGFSEMLKNPATIEAAKKMMADPEALKKVQEMMKDPAAVSKMEQLMTQPAFREQVEKLRKDSGLPGSDVPLTEEMLQNAKKLMGFPAGTSAAASGSGKAPAAIDAEFVESAPPKTFATAKAGTQAAAADVGGTFPPIVEIREYLLNPYMAAQYMKATTVAADLRKSLVPLRLFSLPDTGSTLNKATHMYFYSGGLPARDAARGKAAASADWQEYLAAARPCMLEQKSKIYTEAPLPKSMMVGMSAMSVNGAGGSDPLYEIRTYQLKLGYNSVPLFLDHYTKGLPAKLKTKHATSELVSVLLSEIGDANEVIEVWRHGDGTRAMHSTRVSARGAPAWKTAVDAIANLSVTFNTAVHKPAAFSTWK